MSRNEGHGSGDHLDQAEALDTARLRPRRELLALRMKLDPRVRTGIASTDFPHIRKADLTLDRPVGITDRHGSRVEVKVEVTPAN